MPNHIRLFERPLVADEVIPTLMVTGVLPGYTAGAAYEGRLPILNSVGKCTVEVLESTLPPGAFVRVDNITKEVVVKWAAYKEEEEAISAVPSGDFEDGDAGSWSLGNGWSIGTGLDYDAKSGAYSARFAGVKTKGSDMVSPRVPAKVNDYIRVSAQVQQGASAKGNAGARVSLIYRNADGAELLRLWGNLVTSGKNGAWNETVAEGAAPADTATVEVVLSAYRNRENHALWVDDVSWDHKYSLGQNSDESYFLYLKVTDSLNRVAYWSGSVDEFGVLRTSQLYPIYSIDSLATDHPGQLTASLLKGNIDTLRITSAEIISGVLRTPLNLVEGFDQLTASSPSITSGSGLRDLIQKLSLDADDLTSGHPTINSGGGLVDILRAAGDHINLTINHAQITGGNLQ